LYGQESVSQLVFLRWSMGQGLKREEAMNT
jgi:hypothetical protein